MDEPLKIQNLLLASVLIAGGARLTQIESGPKLSTVHLDTDHLDNDRLAKAFQHLATDLAGTEDLTADTLNWLFDSSILGTIESEYRRLKRLVVSKRGRN